MNGREIYGYFQQKAMQNHALFQVEIDVTSKCNANCSFCFQGTHENKYYDMSLEKIVNLLDDLRSMGTFFIGFSGGEPFARADFLEILNEAKKRKFRISVISNGMLLSKSDIDRLAELQIDRVTISFHGISQDTYLKSFGINNPSCFSRAIENIDYMLQKGISLGIAITVTKYNIGELEEITNFFLQKGLKSSDINYNMLLSGKRKINELMPTQEQITENVNYLSQKIGKEEKHALCNAGIISCSIDSRGYVYPCTFFNNYVGNIFEQSIKDIWENSHFLKILRSLKDSMFEKCADCALKGKCNMCLATNLNDTGDIFIPSEMFCQSRKARIGDTIC